MSEVIGRVDRVHISPVVGLPAATVDAAVPETLFVGMSGLSIHGVETFSFEVVSTTTDQPEPVSAQLLARAHVDIQHDRLELSHPQVGAAVLPTVSSLRHRNDPVVQEFLSELIGQPAQLHGPSLRRDVDYIGGIGLNDELNRYGVLRMAVTPEPTGLMYDEGIAQPVIPGVDIVSTGIGDAVAVGNAIVVRQYAQDRYQEFSGWVIRAQDLGFGGQEIRVADIRYHNDRQFGRGISVGSQILTEEV